MSDDLAPLRTALLRSARTEAARLRAEAEAYRDAALAEARGRAETIRAEARERGRADAAALVATDLAATGRAARQIVLSARRDAYRDLCREVRRTAAAWLGEPAVRKAFQALAADRLGPEATVDPGPAGLTAAAGGRQLELRADTLADAAVRRLGATLEELWEP